MKSHRELYPEQYAHPLCGKMVQVRVNGQIKASGRVERVVGSQFGKLAILEADYSTAWRVEDCLLDAPEFLETEIGL